MADRSIAAPGRAAKSDDVPALIRRAERLLRGSERQDPVEAAGVLDRATRLGSVEAPAILAKLFALGIGAPRNWTAALDLLEIGAERGSTSARGQLAALADLDEAPSALSAAPSDPWPRPRASIDLEAWSSPGPRQALSRSPRIDTHVPFASPAVRAWVIDRARGRIAPAKVYDPETPRQRVEDIRTNGAFEFQLADMDVVMAMLRERIAAAVGVSPSALEPPQVLHYRVGQQFDNHYDFFDPDLPGHVPELTEHGQRIITCLVYLNDDFEGGETEFPLIGQRCRPPAGGALCFVNVQPSGTPDRRTLHAGLTPTRGEKWLLSQWIRDRS